MQVGLQSTRNMDGKFPAKNLALRSVCQLLAFFLRIISSTAGETPLCDLIFIFRS
jgi:hypothetical protein